MDTITITDLKTSPAKAISASEDYPIAVQKRNKTQAYIVGKDIFEKLVSFVEDYIDISAAKKANYKETRDFEDIASELGL